jgi:hypothetical protein
VYDVTSVFLSIRLRVMSVSSIDFGSSHGLSILVLHYMLTSEAVRVIMVTITVLLLESEELIHTMWNG